MSAELVPAAGQDLTPTPRAVPDLARVVKFTAAWDKRSDNPATNYGIHGVELRMYLGSPEGAVQFVLFTGWHWLDGNPPRNNPAHAPIPADLGYHSPVPHYDGQETLPCDIIAGGRCYYDGSGLNAYPVYEMLLRGGDEAVWAYLEGYYAEVFGLDGPEATP